MTTRCSSSSSTFVSTSRPSAIESFLSLIASLDDEALEALENTLEQEPAYERRTSTV